MSPSLKIIFAGTPDFAARHLQSLLSSHHEVIAVYTQPDRPAGRGKKLTASPVKSLALEHNILIHQPANFKAEEDKAILAELNADLMVVVAYGLLLPKAVLDTPRLGCINVHGSLLPRWRGAAPIQRAIWAGDTETGVTIMQMDEGLDTGDMLDLVRLPIEAQDTSATLYDKLAELGPDALVNSINNIAVGNIHPQKQDDKLANYAKKLSKEEAKIDWNDTAEHIERCIRAFNPWPMSYFSIEDESSKNDNDTTSINIKVWRARVTSINDTLLVNERDAIKTAPVGCIVKADKTGIYVTTKRDILVLEQLQLPGKKALSIQDTLNGHAAWFAIGKQLV